MQNYVTFATEAVSKFETFVNNFNTILTPRVYHDIEKYLSKICLRTCCYHI